MIPLENPAGGKPVAVAVLEPAEPGGPPRLVVAAQEGECTRIGVLERGRTAGVPVAELPFRIEGRRAFQHWDMYGSLFKPEGLVKFAPHTWAVYLSGKTDRDWLVVQTLRDGKIWNIPLTPPLHDSGMGIGGVCQGPGERLAVQVSPDKGRRMQGLLYSSEGKLVGGTSVLEDFSEEEEIAYGSTTPLVWNDSLGLLMNSFGNEIIISLRFEAGAVPHGWLEEGHGWPEELRNQLFTQDYNSFAWGGLRLSDGRSLLVYPFSAVILETPERPVILIGEPGGWPSAKHIVGTRPHGALVIEDDWIGALSLAYPPGEPRCEEDATQVPRGFEQIASDGSRYRLEQTQDGVTLSRAQDDGWVHLWALQDLLHLADVFRLLPEQVLSDLHRVDVFLREVDVSLRRGNTSLNKECRSLEGWCSAWRSSMSLDLVDVSPRGGDRWRVCVAVIQREGERSLLRVCLVDLSSAAGTWSPAAEPSRIDLGDEVVTSCTVIDPDHFAVGYESGRIEVFSLVPNREGRRRILAVGFPLSAPTDLNVWRGERGVYLAAVAGGLVWFDLSVLYRKKPS
jgi:hypothetical protein